MSPSPAKLFSDLAAEIPAGEEHAAISLPQVVARWLHDGPRVFEPSEREPLHRLCRQVDVRKKISRAYGTGWRAASPEEPADAATTAGLVAVLLANAAAVTDPPPDGSVRDGWGLKCVNTALKALEMRDDLPHAAALRLWAATALDTIGEPTPR